MYLAQFPDITHIKVHNGFKLAISKLNELTCSGHFPPLNCTFCLYGNGLAILHGLPDIRHINVNYGRCSATLNLIKWKFFRGYPYLKPQILFYSKGLATLYLARFVRYQAY